MSAAVTKPGFAITSAVALVISVTAGSLAFGTQGPPAGPRCSVTGSLTRVPALPEGSGVAVGRAVPGQLWSHNDSGRPVLVKLDSTGAVTGRVTIEGARVVDWEAIAVGPCAGGSCVYIGDIGDNDGTRREITIYRVREAATAANAATAESMRAVYPDRPQDAEALIVTPEGRLFVITKGHTGPPAVYRFPETFLAGGTVRLERIGSPRGSKALSDRDRITDAGISANGEWVVLRTQSALMFHRASQLLAGDWREASRVDLAGLKEPQGEAVAFGPKDTVYVVGEGGGKSRPGTFAALSCTAFDH